MGGSDSNAADRAKVGAELAVTWARAGAIRLSSTLTRTAEQLDRSADLAEIHAIRRERDGRPDDAAKEYLAAARGREAAERARSESERWRRRANQQ
jgi:hypothetical protein